MDKTTYYATMAQLLPVVAIAGALELRFFLRRVAVVSRRSGRLESVFFWLVAIYSRLLMLAVATALFLTQSFVSALARGKDLWSVADAIATPVLGIIIGLLISPFIIGLVLPSTLIDAERS